MNENVYKQLVAKAKGLLKARQELKYEIAKIALKVCDIRVGGKTGAQDYTLVRFAEDIGMNPNTLHRWKREYELVVSKIKENKPVRKALEGTLKRVNKDTPASEVKIIYQEEVKKFQTDDDYLLHDHLKRLKNIDFSINHSFELSKMDQDTLVWCMQIARSIADGIQDHLDGKRKKNGKAVSAVEQVNALLAAQ